MQNSCQITEKGSLELICIGQRLHSQVAPGYRALDVASILVIEKDFGGTVSKRRVVLINKGLYFFAML